MDNSSKVTFKTKTLVISTKNLVLCEYSTLFLLLIERRTLIQEGSLIPVKEEKQ